MIKTKTAITFLLVCASSVAISFTTSASKDTAEEESYYESVIETTNNKEVVSTIRESKHVEREIEEDLTGFVDDFNHSDYLNDVVLRNVENKEEYALDATSIEYSNSVYIIEKEIYGTYLDFNEDNGYAVIGSNRTIYEIQIEGDLEELRDGQDLLYSTLDGFVYFDENNVCQRMFENLEPSYMDAVNDEDEINETDPDYYVAVPNLGNYTYIDGASVITSEFVCYRQYQTSYYQRVPCDEDGNKVSGDYSSEGNCAPTAMFNILNSWAQNSKISITNYGGTTDVSEIIKNDDKHDDYIVKNNVYINSGGDGYHYWILNYDKYITVMPNLYINVRNVASKNGFTPEYGMYDSRVADTLKEVGDIYGTEINASLTTTVSEALKSINSHKAVYMSVYGSKKYGNHGMALLGYEIYRYTSTISTYRAESTIYVYKVANGHDDSIVYYCPSEDGNPQLNFVVKE